MQSFNATGNLTKDVELRYVGANNTAVVDLGFAMNDREKHGDEWKDVPTFIDITVWGRRAELCAEYLHKGSKIAVKGKVKQESWDDAETGAKRYKHKIVAEEIEFLDKKSVDSDEKSEKSEKKPSGKKGKGKDDIPF